MVKNLSIGKANFCFVGKYRYKKGMKLTDRVEWRAWKIGVWFKRSLIVGNKEANNPKKWKDNFVKSYMLGFDLLLFKGWIEYNYNGLELKVDL